MLGDDYDFLSGVGNKHKKLLLENKK